MFKRVGKGVLPEQRAGRRLAAQRGQVEGCLSDHYLPSFSRLPTVTEPSEVNSPCATCPLEAQVRCVWGEGAGECVGTQLLHTPVPVTSKLSADDALGLLANFVFRHS